MSVFRAGNTRFLAQDISFSLETLLAFCGFLINNQIFVPGTASEHMSQANSSLGQGGSLGSVPGKIVLWGILVQAYYFHHQVLVGTDDSNLVGTTRLE
jgi:hypothetical protein